MEPIAIIGTSCRFPGAANLEAFWQLLWDGGDAVGEVPPSRWQNEHFYHPQSPRPGKISSRWGGFLNSIDEFDPQFFGISPREAPYLDPQQRLLLEVAWEALENGGLVPQQLARTPTGVFIGISGSDYDRLGCRDFENLSAYSATGTASSIAANRLSYLFNLRGPSLGVDTACSSSLVAVHLACQSLNSGESDLCLAGGVNLMLWPGPAITLSQAQMLATDGRCKTFDGAADGYVRGEGCGVVILKRLSEALADGDNIQAVIKGSAVNQDGTSNGLTAPNGLAQRAVIRQALERAGVAPAQISYVEAHGTGTPLGDPIEVKALQAVLLAGREPHQTCWLGSVKTNIGHLEAAAGIAGLIKVVLQLQHQTLVPHLHLQRLNPYIRLAGTPVKIPTRCQRWSSRGEGLLAGVSSFGFGGTNCHLIVEEAPSPAPVATPPQGGCQLLTLSAKSEGALRELAGRYADYLASHPEVSLADLCLTANTRRQQFQHRLALRVETHQQLCRELGAFAAGEEGGGIVTGIAERQPPPAGLLVTAGKGKGDDEWRQLLEKVAREYVRGVAIDWKEFYGDFPGRRLPLPTYPFQRQRFWLERAQDNFANKNGHSEEIEALLQQTAKLLPKLLQVLQKYERSPAKTEFSEEMPFEVELPSEPQPGWLWQKLKAAPQNERLACLIAQIQHEVASVLRFDSSELPNPNLGFFDMGMDSLLAVELKNRLENSLGTTISSTVAFNHPNIESLARYLLSKVLNLNGAKRSEISPKQASDKLDLTVDRLEQLSEAEVEALLVQKLANL